MYLTLQDLAAVSKLGNDRKNEEHKKHVEYISDSSEF